MGSVNTPKTQVSAKQMEHAAKRFPYNTPVNEEAYLFPTFIFESHFPLASAAECVPGGPISGVQHTGSGVMGRQFAAN